MRDRDRPPADTLAIRFARWLSDPDGDDDTVAVHVATLPEGAWRAFAAAHPELMTEAAARMLITRAHRLLGRKPAPAVALARMATRVAECVEVPPEEIDGTNFVLLSGDAWREYAHALRHIGDYKAALAACEEASFFYGTIAADLDKTDLGDARTKELRRAVDYRSAILMLIEGRTRALLGEVEVGLHMIGEAALTLSLLNEKQKFVQARIIYANVLLGQKRVHEALAVFDDTAAIAKDASDPETMAHMVQSVAVCSLELGDLRRARECFSHAVTMFTDHGMVAEACSARAGLANVAARQGRYLEAISELYKSRAEFLALGMVVTAAEVALDIVEFSLVAGKEKNLVTLCTEMLTTFREAGLTHEGMKALAYLRELATARRVDRHAIADLKGFFQQLEAAPETRFSPPSVQ